MNAHAELATVRLTDAGAAYHHLPAGEVGTVIRNYPAVSAVRFAGYTLPCLPAEIEPLPELPAST